MIVNQTTLFLRTDLVKGFEQRQNEIDTIGLTFRKVVLRDEHVDSISNSEARSLLMHGPC